MAKASKALLLWAVLPLVFHGCVAAPANPVLEPALDYAWWGVEFPTSATGQAQQHFLNGVTAMHLYMFEDAEAEFRAAQELDPDFAMAYWGEAMTHYRPIWRDWEYGRARAVMERLGSTREVRLATAETERERAYLEALELLFAEGPPPAASEPRESHTRLLAYERAMKELTERYPDDVEALALWAGARVVMFPRTERRMQERMRTAAAAQEVLTRSPRHPGGARSLLQSTDDPIHAVLGWPAVEVFLEAPPSATDAEAQHIPTHTFAQLGMWREMGDRNWQAFETSMRWATSRGVALTELDGHNYSHLLLYAQYGYLQSGQYERAAEIVERARRDFQETGEPTIGNVYVSALAWQLVGTADPEWIDPLVTTAEQLGTLHTTNVQYALGLTGWRSEDASLAREALRHVNSTSGSDPAAIMRGQLAGIAALAEGDEEGALAHLREAARVERARIYSQFGTATPMMPAHELLGEVLLDLSRPDEALDAFEDALWIYSKRPASLRGAAQAAAAAGQRELAETYRSELEGVLVAADPAARNLAEVRRER